jgi:hypothetical protein
MSYDIWLEADLGGPERIAVGTSWNYTSNCSAMWRKAGADLAEFHGKTAAECAPVLAAGIAALKADPETYRAMNPGNGWGDYDTLVESLRRLLANFRAAPAAYVHVWR